MVGCISVYFEWFIMIRIDTYNIAAIRAFILSKACCIFGVHLNGGDLTPFLGSTVLAVSGDKSEICDATCLHNN
jgi:hypothetical protein